MKPDDGVQGQYPFSDEVREWLVENEAKVTKEFIVRYTDALGCTTLTRLLNIGDSQIGPD